MAFDRFVYYCFDHRSGIQYQNDFFERCKDNSMLKIRKDVIDITGQKFGRLTALRPVKYKDKSRRLYWECKCDCGRITRAPGTELRRGYRISCGCRGVRRARSSAVHALYGGYVNSARKRNIYFYLSEDVFESLITQNCFYCGIEPMQVRKCNKNQVVYNGIDRIDSNGDYTKANCVSCCKNCNYAKNEQSMEEFKKYIERVYKCLIGS